jgi:hypothetical protein
METYPVLRKSEKLIQNYRVEYKKNALMGYEEPFFFSNLKREIDILFPIDLLVSNHIFRPDALYIDNNIVLDIEIDEPYVYNSFRPIHYIGSDEWRDEMLNYNGISVLRFAEYQVKMFPNICNQIVINVVNNRYHLSNIEFESKFIVNRWTKSQALDYIEEEKRNYYDFVTEKIVEDKSKIVKIFPDFDNFFEYCLSNVIEEFSAEIDDVFIPYRISDLKTHELTNENMIFCDFIRENRRNVLSGVYYRFHLYKNKNNDLFNLIYYLKTYSNKIKLTVPRYKKYDLYNMVFWGRHSDFGMNSIKYKKIV